MKEWNGIKYNYQIQNKRNGNIYLIMTEREAMDIMTKAGHNDFIMDEELIIKLFALGVK